VARDENEPVGEGFLGVADIPPHETAEQGRHEGVHLRSGTARMAALAVVEHDVDKLIGAVLDLLPLLEMGSRIREEPIQIRLGWQVRSPFVSFRRGTGRSDRLRPPYGSSAVECGEIAGLGVGVRREIDDDVLEEVLRLAAAVEPAYRLRGATEVFSDLR